MVTLEGCQDSVDILAADNQSTIQNYKPFVGLLNRFRRMHSGVFAQIAQQLGIRRVSNLADWQL